MTNNRNNRGLSPIIQFIAMTLVCWSGCGIAYADKLPVSGTKSTLCTAMTNKIQDVLSETEFKAVTFSMLKNDRVICRNGFGYGDKDLTTVINADAKMRIASIGKPVAAILIKDLIKKGKLNYDTKVFNYLDIKPYRNVKPFVDGRVENITIQNLLDHKLGWDKKHDGYARTTLEKVKNISGQDYPSVISISRYMIGQQLQFNPGKKKVYSNYGYALIKAIVEKTTKQDYVDYLASHMAKYDVSIIASENVDARNKTEVWYRPETQPVEFSFAISAMDLAKIFTRYWVNGDIRTRSTRSYTFYGSWDGTTSIIRQRKDRITYALLINERGTIKHKEIKQGIDRAIDRLSAFFN